MHIRTIYKYSLYILFFAHILVVVVAQNNDDTSESTGIETPIETSSETPLETGIETGSEEIEATDKIAEAFTADQKNIINSINISNDYDLLLWVNGLGLDAEQGARASLQQTLLTFYGLPLDVFEEKKEEQVEDNQDEKSDPSKEEDKNLVKVETVEEEDLGEGTADELIINTANSARYFTYEKVNEDVFILQGNVQILINQTAKKRQHLITTDKLIYNETTRTGTAVGEASYRVYEYEKEPFEEFEGKEAVEEFDSQIISFNIDSFNADILAGNTRTEKEMKFGKDKALTEKLTFRIYSPHLSRSEDNVIVVSNASFTSSKAIPPLYTIKLKNMWLLTPDEWAISSASIFVGDIPVMWLPFFVNPGDKFFFHPSIGFKTRTGGFINTTTYLIGEHKRADEDEEFLNLFNFSKQKSKKKIIKGLYLREAEAGDTIRTYPKDWLLRYIADYYTGLGFYSGLEGKFSKLFAESKNVNINTIEFNTGIAFTQTVYNSNNTYFNYYIDEKGRFKRNYDNGYFFNRKVPFRYKFDVKAGTTLYYVKTNIAFQLYSDSFFNRDFSQRAYDFSWDQILDPNKRIKELNSRVSQQGSFFWQVNNNFNMPKIPVFGNYINSLSISNLRVQMNWNRKNILPEDEIEAYTLGPGTVEQRIESFFFYPSQVEIPSYQARMSGTLLSFDTVKWDFLNGIKLNEEKKKARAEAKKEKTKEKEKQVEAQKKALFEEKYNPPNYDINEPSATDNTGEEQENEDIEDTLIYPNLTLGAVNIPQFEWSKARFKLDYAITQSLNQIIYYDADKFIKPELVDVFDDNYFSYAYLTNNSNGKLSFATAVLDGWADYKYAVQLDLKYRILNYDKNLKDTERELKRKSTENYTKEDLTNSHVVTVYPLKWLPIMAASNISYTADYFLGKNVFGTVDMAKWYEENDDKDWWKQHAAKQSYNVKYAGVSQTANLNITLPPYDLEHLYKYSLTSLFFDASVSTRLVEERATKIISYEPLKADGSLKFFENKLSFKESVSYEYEFNYIDKLTSLLKVWWWTSTLQSEHTETFNFNKFSFAFESPDKYDKRLRFKSWKNTVQYTASPFYFWKDRINIAPTTQLDYNYDFIRFTNDYFEWTYGINIDIYQYLSLTISSSVKNDVVYMYSDEFAVQIGAETRDFWKDVEYSLSLGDEKKLRESAFKIGTVKMGATQDFGGWVFSIVYTGEAKRDTGSLNKRFEWKNQIEMAVYWKPLPEFKSQAFLRDDEWSLDEEVEGANK